MPLHVSLNFLNNSKISSLRFLKNNLPNNFIRAQVLFYLAENLQDKIDAKFMFIVTVKDVKSGDELTANYNLYTYPKTGVGLQMI